MAMRYDAEEKMQDAQQVSKDSRCSTRESSGSSGSVRLTLRVAQPAWHVADSMTR